MLRAELPEPLVPYDIVGCSGYGTFVRECVRLSSPPADTRFTVAESAGSTVGCAEWRLLPSSVLLNHVYVVPECRASGVGRALVAEGINTAGRRRVELDAFEDNVRALDWYRRLGFAKVRRTRWILHPAPPADRTVHAEICDMTQAVRLDQVYGFSAVMAVSGRGAYQIGLLGSAVLRATDPGVLRDKAVLGVLGAAFPGRPLLVISPDSPSVEGGDVLATSLRMSGETALIAKRLLGALD